MSMCECGNVMPYSERPRCVPCQYWYDETEVPMSDAYERDPELNCHVRRLCECGELAAHTHECMGEVGRIRMFSSGATRDTAEGKPEFAGFLSPIVLRRFGKYMDKHRVQSDGNLRASDNWKAGFPRRQTLESLLRHTIDVWENVTGDFKDEPPDVEDALCAVIFNAQSLLREILLGRDVKL